MTAVEPGGATAAAAEAFGRALAGRRADAWIGMAPMRNATGADWPAWYAEHRVRPYLRAAVDQGVLAPGDAAAVTEVCERIDDLAGPAEPRRDCTATCGAATSCGRRTAASG